MNEFFVLAAHNTLAALILALFVLGTTAIWRNQPLAHVLWLLVLIQLIVPPVWRVDWSALLPYQTLNAKSRSNVAHLPRWPSLSADGSPAAESMDRIPSQPLHPTSDRSVIPVATLESMSRATAGGLTESLPMIWNRAHSLLFLVWLGGAIACALISARRILRFNRLLRDTLPPPAHLQRMARDIAAKMGVNRLPRICYVDCVDTPL